MSSKAYSAYQELIKQKKAEIEKYALDNKDVMLPYLRLHEELRQLEHKRTQSLFNKLKDIENDRTLPF